MVGLVLALPACTVGLDFSPGALQPSLDGGGRDALSGADATPDAVSDNGCDGRCACATGRGDCDGVAANGCETDLTATENHCGACGTSCGPGAHRCCRGVCAVRCL